MLCITEHCKKLETTKNIGSGLRKEREADGTDGENGAPYLQANPPILGRPMVEDDEAAKRRPAAEVDEAGGVGLVPSCVGSADGPVQEGKQTGGLRRLDSRPALCRNPTAR